VDQLITKTKEKGQKKQIRPWKQKNISCGKRLRRDKKEEDRKTKMKSRARLWWLMPVPTFGKLRSAGWQSHVSLGKNVCGTHKPSTEQSSENPASSPHL
jgi:hypothetical protein